MDLLQSIDALLQLNVVGRKLGLTSRQLAPTLQRYYSSAAAPYLVIGLSQLLPNILLGARGEGGERGTVGISRSALDVMAEVVGVGEIGRCGRMQVGDVRKVLAERLEFVHF